MNDLKKLMEMKGKKKLDPMAKKAKLGVLGELKKYASDMMTNDVKGLKKVTVAAPDEEGLEEGMDKAKELLGSEEEEDEAVEGESLPESEELAPKLPDSPEEIEAMIKLLEEKKAKLGMLEE